MLARMAGGGVGAVDPALRPGDRLDQVRSDHWSPSCSLAQGFLCQFKGLFQCGQMVSRLLSFVPLTGGFKTPHERLLAQYVALRFPQLPLSTTQIVFEELAH